MHILRASLLAIAVGLGLAIANGTAVLDADIKVGQARLIGVKPVNAKGGGSHLKSSPIIAQNVWVSGEAATANHGHLIVGGGAAANVANPTLRTKFYFLVELRGKLFGFVATSGLRKGEKVSSTGSG